ncbi:MAG: hypothetical protein L0Z50_04570 [Verrucomicrobiales bacterium]|nr:hypothetical protein [Verrucomicrobiales bacterium]
MSKAHVGVAILWLLGTLPAFSQTSGVIHYQGRILSGNTAFDGPGQFKFALVNNGATQTYWRSSADANNDGEPDQAVSVPVQRGLYSVHLGDTTVANMAAIPLSVFTDNITDLGVDPMYLRVWFNDGVNGFQRLSPDHTISAVSFAMAAAHAQVALAVPDASITAAKLAPNSLQAGSLVGTIDVARLPANVALKNPDVQNVANDLAAQVAGLQTQIDTLKARVTLLETSGGGGGSSSGVLASTSPNDPALTSLGFVNFTSISAPPWMNGSNENAPSARSHHAAAWSTGLGQWFVWGGQVGAGIYSGSGAIYRAATGEWQPVSPVGAPSERRGHGLVMSAANEAFVWGGFNSGGYLNSGARYVLGGAAWGGIAAQNAPAARDGHSVAWINPLLLVWGGRNASGPLGDGATYNADTEQWAALNLPGGPTARFGASTVQAGNRVFIWGGTSASGALNSGAYLVFQTAPAAPQEWRPISTTGAPSPRSEHAAVWTGTRLIVWGGFSGSTLLGDGASYDPATDTWQPLSATDAPSPRRGHAALWTGEEMLIIGGDAATGPTATGAAHNPATGRWRGLQLAGDPVARSLAAVAWTGADVLVFGGQSGALPVAALQQLSPQPTWYFYRKP